MSIDEEEELKTAELTVHLDSADLIGLSSTSEELKASLVVMTGTDVGRTLPLSTHEPVVIGRDPKCSYTIDDEGISRRHAEITYKDPGIYIIRDLNSTNGMFFEGERVMAHRLSDGDKILLGRRTIVKLVLQDTIDSQYQNQIYESAVRDPLTGAFNRKHFDEHVTSELSFARRYKMPLTLLMMDLDFFKNVNDHHGHQMGDQVLMSVTKILSDSLRKDDFLARYGGEEFVVIARGIPAKSALVLGERVRQAIENMKIVTPEGEKFSITASIGIVTASNPTGIDVATLLNESDKNLYRAKEAGRNRVVASEIKSSGPPVLTSKKRGAISIADELESKEGE
jgi:diguanylate cyclase (GGDEF)-like protein